MALDVLILGGGVAGLTAALGLRERGLRVALLEVRTDLRWRIGETLSAEARPLLQSLRLWESHVAAGHLPSHGNVSCWGWEAAVDKDFCGNVHGHAWQMDRVSFEAMLARAAEERGVQRWLGQGANDLQRHSQQWSIALGEARLSAPWLVDATGRRCWVARQLGVRRQPLDALVAIHAIAKSDAAADRDSRTFVESLPDGWFYGALVPRGRRTVSFQTDPDLLPKHQGWRSKEWFQHVLGQTRHLGAWLAQRGSTIHEGPQLTSAHSGRLERFSGPGWLAIGDAAMSFDPISGNGLLKAMQSALHGAEAIAAGIDGSLADFDAWNEHIWRQFVRARRECYAAEIRWAGYPFWRRRT